MTTPITIETTVPAVSDEEAQRIAEQSVADLLPRGAGTASRAELIIFRTDDAEPRLAWEVAVRPVDERGRPYAVCVDARTRAVLSKEPTVPVCWPSAGTTAP